jgi:hypothetical protein
MNDLHDVYGTNIPLSEMVETLRQELQLSMKASEGKGLRFKVEKIEIELQVLVNRAKEAGAKIEFSVLSAEAKHARDRGFVHTFKLSLVMDRPNQQLLSAETEARFTEP